jgi:hypothetical protein
MPEETNKQPNQMPVMVGLILLVIINGIMFVSFSSRISDLEAKVTAAQNANVKTMSLLPNLVEAITALNNKVDDIQKQRYYAWVEKYSIPLTNIPSCISETYGNSISVFLVGESVSKFSLNDNSTMVLDTKGTVTCYDVRNNSTKVPCENLCALGGGSAIQTMPALNDSQNPNNPETEAKL